MQQILKKFQYEENIIMFIKKYGGLRMLGQIPLNKSFDKAQYLMEQITKALGEKAINPDSIEDIQLQLKCVKDVLRKIEYVGVADLPKTTPWKARMHVFRNENH